LIRTVVVVVVIVAVVVVIIAAATTTLAVAFALIGAHGSLCVHEVDRR